MLTDRMGKDGRSHASQFVWKVTCFPVCPAYVSDETPVGLWVTTTTLIYKILLLCTTCFV